MVAIERTATPSQTDEYSHATLQQALGPLGYSVVPPFTEPITSTMDHARLLGVQKAVVIAEVQTAGRGQYGRSWEGLKNRSVLATIIEPWNLKDGDPRPGSLLPSQMFILTACEALCELTESSDIKIRWPNDLVAHGQKLGGLLVENPAFSNTAPYPLLFGIGINVHFENANAAIPNTSYGAVSIDELGGKYAAREEILIAILKKWNKFRVDLRRIAKDGETSDTYKNYNSRWKKCAALQDARVRIWKDTEKSPDNFIEGVVTDSPLGHGLIIDNKEVIFFGPKSRLEVLV